MVSRPARMRAASLRWAVPSALLIAEYLTLSLLVDLPTAGLGLQLVDSFRVVIPVALGAAAGGWLMARSHGVALQRPLPASAPPWKPWPALGAQLAAFAAVAALAMRLLGRGSEPPGPLPMLGLAACGAVTVALAAASAVPLSWLASQVARRWRDPLLALLLGIAAWRATALAEQWWGAFTYLTLNAAAGLLRLIPGQRVILMAPEAVLGLGDFEVEVAPICSGVDGVGLVLTFQLIWMALGRERFRAGRALWLLPVGAVAALAANVVRIAGLVWLGGAGHPDLALGGFHSKAGWFFFLAIAIATIAVAERSSWLRREPAAEGPADQAAGRPDVALVAPLVLALAAALLTGIWASGPLDRAYALRIVAAAVASWAVRCAIPPLRPTPHFLPALLGGAVGVLWVGLFRGEGVGLSVQLAALGHLERGAWLAARVLGSVLVIPLVEELAFREFLFRWLAPLPSSGGRVRWPWAALVGSSMAFATLHSNLPLGFAAGLAFGLVRAWRGRVGDAVIAHAVANGVVAALALLGRWELWM